MVWEQGTESEVSVELDAADEVQKRGAMADMGLTPAGWYACTYREDLEILPSTSSTVKEYYCGRIVAQTSFKNYD